MFTGIVEEVGRIVSPGQSGAIRLRASTVLNGTKLGDSIAVNGVCLTVTALYPDGFSADVMPETLRRSNLGNLRTGDPVNLERAMAANGRFGGHIVSGHIDGTGIILEQRREGNAVWVRIQTSKEILALIVEKGSVAIDGISLTIATVHDDSFQVSVIPTTAEETILLRKKPGDLVNLENDIVGKYVQKLLGLASASDNSAEQSSGITMDMLQQYGF